MSNKEEVVDQKIRQLAELMKNPGDNEGAALRILHDLFQLTNEGRDLSPDNSEWVNKTACVILPPDLRAVLVKLKLDGYSFHFAALSFTDIEDVIDDLANNGEILKSVKSFPPAVFNKLKRGLLGPRQQDSFNNSMMESTSSSPEAKKIANNEQAEPKKEESSSSPPLGTFLPRIKTVKESPKEMVIQPPALPLNNLKRKLEDETRDTSSSSPSTSRPQPAPVCKIPLNIPVEQRFAQKLRSRCQLVGKHSSGIQLYAIPLSKKPATRSTQAERYVFGYNRRSKAKVEIKTILLMGATGSGKTTLINAMVNYILGVEFEDPFRFLLIREEGTSSSPIDQAESQTSKVTAYELHYQEGFRIPYSLIIVDTPGYGDTKGIDRDHQITSSIEQFFKDKNGIQELDAVGFTVQAALARLTPTQKYIFESILAIFGNDVKDNISFLVTFTDGRKPPVLDAIKAANIAHQLDTHGHPRHHRFNNSGFFSSENDEDENFSPSFWKLGMKNFESFFSGLSLMKTRSLTLTKEVLEERKHINVTVEGLTLKIHMQLTKMEELRKTKQMIETHKDQINSNKDFKYNVTVSRGDKIEITDGKCTTNCSKCSMSCHFPCGLSITDDKRNCAAMGKEDGLCKSCPLKCKWDLHLNQNYHWKFQDVTETRTYSEILQKYQDAIQRKLTTEGVVQALESELEQSKYDLRSDINTIADCLQRLDQIALRPDAFSAAEYIQLMILSETKEKKPGYQERIKSLDSLMEKANIVKKIRLGKSVLPEAGAAADQSRSQSRVTIEPQLPCVKRTSMDWPKGMLKRAQQYTPWAKDEFDFQQELDYGRKKQTRQQSRYRKEGGWSD